MQDDTSDPCLLARAAQRKAIQRRRRAARRATPVPSPSDDSVALLSPTQRVGRKAEAQAEQHITATGAKVLCRNLLCRAGEIDLVCLDGEVLAFVEVRHRESRRFGGAAASVGALKQQRLARAAAYFLPKLTRRYFRGHIPPCRFDVIALEGDELAWLKGVFNNPF